MTFFFFLLGIAGALLTIALLPRVSATMPRIGLAFLALAAVSFCLAGRYPMDPVGTLSAAMSFSGKAHGVAFLLGMPSVLAATFLLSLPPGRMDPEAAMLLPLATIILIGFVVVVAINLMIGPGKPVDPDGPERFLGLSNRLMVVAYAVWIVFAARIVAN